MLIDKALLKGSHQNIITAEADNDMIPHRTVCRL